MRGADLAVKQRGGMVAGKKIDVLYRDTTGPAAEVARRESDGSTS